MRVINFFLSDLTFPTEEEYSRARLLIGVLLLLLVITGCLSTMGLFGFFSGITNFFIFLVLSANLFFFKAKGNLDVTFFVTTVVCTSLMVYNTVSNGYIMSLNNKWFIVALLTIFFMKPKWMTPYAMFLAILQTYYLLVSINHSSDPTNNGIFIEEYIDNILFFGLCYALLYRLYLYQKSQLENISQSNELLEEKTSELIESNQELENFASIVAHDLRSPLRNMIRFSGLLQRSITNNNYSKLDEYADYIKNGCFRMNTLIQDVLVYSQLTSTQKSKESVNLNQVFEEVKESLCCSFLNENIEIIKENDLPIIMSHKSRMSQLLKNFMENGLKYNQSEKPTIRVKYHSGNCLSITDNGIGISDKHYKAIFNMFTRLHTEHQYEGTGIGLFTCKKLMDKLGGRIQVDSNVGKGTMFELYFPTEIIEK